MATIEASITADASEALKALESVQRQMIRLAIEPVVAAWCPNLNDFGKSQFVEELLDAL